MPPESAGTRFWSHQWPRILSAAGVWIRGIYRAAQAIDVVDIMSRQLGLLLCDVATVAETDACQKTPAGAERDDTFAPSASGAQIETA